MPTLLELLQNKLNLAGARDKTVNVKIAINTAWMIERAEASQAVATLNLLKEAQARLFLHCGNDDLYERLGKAITKLEA